MRNRMFNQSRTALRPSNRYARGWAALPATKRDAVTHEKQWLALLDDWAGLNGVRRSGQFTLEALARGGCSGGAWGRPYTWPGCDHPSFFRRERRAAAVVAEPYVPSDVERLHLYADEKGLVLHSPPNPKASFWFPGYAYFFVITAPGFGPVRWLPEQVAFGERAPA